MRTAFGLRAFRLRLVFDGDGISLFYVFIFGHLFIAGSSSLCGRNNIVIAVFQNSISVCEFVAVAALRLYAKGINNRHILNAIIHSPRQIAVIVANRLGTAGHEVVKHFHRGVARIPVGARMKGVTHVGIEVGIVNKAVFVDFVKSFQEFLNRRKVPATDEVMKIKQVGALGWNVGRGYGTLKRKEFAQVAVGKGRQCCACLSGGDS